MNDIVFGNYKVHFYVVGLCRYFVEQLQSIADSNFCGGGLDEQFVVISFSSSQSIQLLSNATPGTIIQSIEPGSVSRVSPGSQIPKAPCLRNRGS